MPSKREYNTALLLQCN